MKNKNRIGKINVVEASLTLKRVGDLFFGPFDVFDRKNIHFHYYFSIVAEIIIHMRDIIYKVEIIGETIQVDTKDSGSKNIAILIKFFRDAICHNDSENRRNKQGYIFSHNVYAAYDFQDEMTILTGELKLYLRRHIFLSYIQAIKIFSSYEEFQTNKDFCSVMEIARYYNALEKPFEFRNSDL